MHFALPPRKPSHGAPNWSRSSRLPFFRRRNRLHVILLCVLGIGAVMFIFSWLTGTGQQLSSGNPPVVIVTVFEQRLLSKSYIKDIADNRKEYARMHGYEVFLPSVTDYELNGAPGSWAKVPAMRHAYTKFPQATYLWFLDQNAMIMNPTLSIEHHIMDPKRMEALMIKDHSIVPPDSVIKTFGHLRGDQIDFALTQDEEGLTPGSFVIRSGDWAKFFLDTWFDPLYRSYNFQRADTHALEHIVQWHPTILSKLALIPQRNINAYSNTTNIMSHYEDGDFVVRFAGCELNSEPTCEIDAQPFIKRWRTIVNAHR